MSWDLSQIRKSSNGKVIAGVCSGLGETTPVPTWIWRVLWVGSVLMGGVGFVLYLLFWIFMPKGDRYLIQQ